MPPSALVTLALRSAWRGAFSAATKLVANVATSTPEPAPKVLTILLAAALAELLVAGVAVAVEVPEVVAVTMVYFTANYLM
jgi:hypothetical protein